MNNTGREYWFYFTSTSEWTEIFCCVQLTFGVLTFLLNVIALKILRSCKRIIGRDRVFHYSLCMSDLVGGMSLGIYAVSRLFPTTVTRSVSYSVFGALDYMSSLMSLAIVTDRLFILIYHVKYSCTMTKLKVCAVVIVAITIAYSLSLIPFLYDTSERNTDLQIQMWSQITLYVALIIVCLKTTLIVRKHRKQILASMPRRYRVNSPMPRNPFMYTRRPTLTLVMRTSGTALINIPQLVSILFLVNYAIESNVNYFMSIGDCFRNLKHVLNAIMFLTCYKECRYLILEFIGRFIKRYGIAAEMMRIEVYEIVTVNKSVQQMRPIGHTKK